MRAVAPAGSPIRLADVARWVALLASNTDVAAELERAVQARFGGDGCFVTSTGRAGMTLLLNGMKRLSPRRTEVILPSYTCYSVAASVMKAGLTPRIVDINPETLDYQPSALDMALGDQVLAVVATNLYGYPNDLPHICAAARAHDAFVIDDAAQAMGASVGGRPCGTWGDAGLFSFDKGKNVSAIDGGLVLTHSPDLTAVLREDMLTVPLPTFGENALGIAKALAYSALLRPSLYSIPNRVLSLGKTVYTTDYPLSRGGRPLTALAATMMGQLDTFTAARTANAAALTNGLSGHRGVRLVTLHRSVTPAFLRFPILLEDPVSRSHVLTTLNQIGIGATPSYPGSVADIPELAGQVRLAGSPSGGRFVAERILTLPTHPYVRSDDIERMVSTIRDTLVDRGRGSIPAPTSDESALCAE